MIDILLPSDQTEGTTNSVGKWFKSVGDRVELNDPLLEITTDKVTVEIAAASAGVLAEILKQEGEAVEPGEVLGRIDAVAPESGKSGGTGKSETATSPGASDLPDVPDSSDQLSPAVKRLLKEHGLSAAAIKGSGRGGRLTVQDVEVHLAGRQQPSTVVPPSAQSARRPHSAMRKSIAEHMVRSMSTAPHVTSVFEADLTTVLAHRQAQQSAGNRLTLTAYFARATVEAIRAVPEANSRWHDDGLELWNDVHLGIATALGTDGLIVPVLRNAHTLDLAATAKGIQDLTERARSGALTPQDVQGGTFTISNHGVSGSLLASPIVINQPQSAILGVGKLQQRPGVIDGAVVPRPMIYVTLTIDHRVLDGFAANTFLTRWVEAIERWNG